MHLSMFQHYFLVLLFTEDEMGGHVRVYVMRMELSIAVYILIKLGQEDGIINIASS